MPQAAFVEDCESDGSNVKPGSRVQARRRSMSVKPTRTTYRAASDSGYSSHSGMPAQGASTSQANNEVTVTTARGSGTVANTSKSKPIIHRSDSRNTRPQPPSRSASISRPPTCNDKNCIDPNCASARNKERRYTLPAVDQSAQYAAYAQHQAQQQQQQYQQPHSSYPQAPPVQPASTSANQQRPRVMTSARARPASMYGYGPTSYTPVHQGPPPSPSAYQNMQAAYYQSYHQPSPVYGSTPPNPIASYLPPSPVIPTSATANYAAAPTLVRTLSARTVDPIPAYSPTKTTVRAGNGPTMSARRHIPGAYQDPESSDSDSDSDSGSSYSSEEEEERERQRRRRARQDKERMPPPARRPSLSQRRTTTSVPSQRTVRAERRTQSDVAYNEVDYERVPRPSASRTRTDSSYSARSRRPSISTTASSGRTPATTISDGSQRVIVEDRHGRRVAYLPKDVRDDLVRRYEQHRLEEQDLKDRVEQYQNTVRGGQPEELTAANIDKMKTAERRTSGSHVSGHSRKSSRSSKASKTDGIRIEANGTILHVYGSANVEMQPGEDGGPARLIINSASGVGRDSTYGGSKSSGGSRQGRSRGTSDIRRIREENHDEYPRQI